MITNKFFLPAYDHCCMYPCTSMLKYTSKVAIKMKVEQVNYLLYTDVHHHYVHYSPGRAQASSTMFLHRSLYCVFLLQFLTFNAVLSSITTSSDLNLDHPGFP